MRVSLGKIPSNSEPLGLSKMSRRKSTTHQNKEGAFISDDGEAGSSSGTSDSEAGGRDGFRGAILAQKTKVLFGARISILLGACVTVDYLLL